MTRRVAIAAFWLGLIWAGVGVRYVWNQNFHPEAPSPHVVKEWTGSESEGVSPAWTGSGEVSPASLTSHQLVIGTGGSAVFASPNCATGQILRADTTGGIITGLVCVDP